MGLESISRFQCDGCKKRHEVKRYDDGKLKPPSTWRFVEIDLYRNGGDRSGYVNGLVCSPECAQTVIARAWRPQDARKDES